LISYISIAKVCTRALRTDILNVEAFFLYLIIIGLTFACSWGKRLNFMVVTK